MSTDRPGRPIEGTTARFVRPHLPCHRLTDDVAARAVQDCFMANVGAGFYGLLVFQSGAAVFAGETPQTQPPPPEVMHFMLDVGREVNAELHANGHWLVAWHPDQRMVLLWRTGKALCKMAVGFDQPWPRMRQKPVAEILETAAAAMLKTAEVSSNGGMEELYLKLAASPGRHGSFALH